MSQKIEFEFSFQKFAMYKIKVQGELKGNWSGKLSGLVTAQ